MARKKKRRKPAKPEKKKTWRSKKSVKLVAMYCTMVAVSTLVIVIFEHSSILSAVRTALVAAIGKTLAANWVSGVFD